MNLRVAAMVNRVRSSLFYVPMVFVIGGVALGQGALALDGWLVTSNEDLPLGLTSTVESARTVLQTVASATITFAAIAFSISLLVIQMASSQYSPRVIHGLFRDPFNKRVMGLVMGTFTYCLVVLRSVRSAVTDLGEPVIPSLSVAFGVVLGLAAILAIVAFINHSAHSMDISEILHGVTQEARKLIDEVWRSREDDDHARRDGSPDGEVPDEEGVELAFRRDGWIQQVDESKLMSLVEPGGVVRFESMVGRYAIAGTAMITVWQPAFDRDELVRLAEAAIDVGKTRTTQQDVAYGLRQLADVALKALSPGINDPTTAQDAIFHEAAVLHELLWRDPPARVREDAHNRTLLLPEQHTHATLVDLAFDEVRRAAAPHPTVCTYLLEALHLLDQSVSERGTSEAREALRRQAELVLAAAERADLVAADAGAVRHAFERRFSG